MDNKPQKPKMSLKINYKGAIFLAGFALLNTIFIILMYDGIIQTPMITKDKDLSRLFLILSVFAATYTTGTMFLYTHYFFSHLFSKFFNLYK